MLPLVSARSADAHPLPALELDDAVALQERIGLGDGHGIDFQLQGHLADRGQEIAGADAAAGHVAADLVHELPIDRHPGGGKDLKEQVGGHVY